MPRSRSVYRYRVCISRRPSRTQRGRSSQARSPIFAVSDDLEEHAPKDSYVVVAKAVDRRRFDFFARAGHFGTKYASRIGDHGNARATVARVVAANDQPHPFEPVQLAHQRSLVQPKGLSQFDLGEVRRLMEGAQHDIVAQLNSMLLGLLAGSAVHPLRGAMQEPGDFGVNRWAHGGWVGWCHIRRGLSRHCWTWHAETDAPYSIEASGVMPASSRVRRWCPSLGDWRGQPGDSLVGVAVVGGNDLHKVGQGDDAE